MVRVRVGLILSLIVGVLGLLGCSGDKPAAATDPAAKSAPVDGDKVPAKKGRIPTR